MKSQQLNPTAKPKLRGVSHEIAAYFYTVAGVWLISQVWGQSERVLAAIIYSLSVVALFGISAFYHRPHWQPKQRQLLRRFDHSAIYILIAGTMIPLAMLCLTGESRRNGLIAIGASCTLGIAKSLLWIRAPKWASALLFVTLAFAFSPFLPAVSATVGTRAVIIMWAGAVIYIVGAVTYVIKRPNPIPGVFGYHEVFHLLVVLAASLHFWMISSLIRGVW